VHPDGSVSGIAGEPPPEALGEATTVEATTGRSVVAGGLWQLTSYAIPQVYTIVMSVVAARFLGPDGMGIQSFIAFVAISTTTALASSMYAALMRYVGETVGQGRNELLRPLFLWAWRVEAGAALLGAGALAVAAAFGAEPRSAWLLAAVGVATGILHSVPTALLIGLQRFRRASVVGLVTGLIATIATVAVLWAGAGITGMFAVEAAVGIINLAWTSLLARRTLAEAAPGPGVDSPELRRSVGHYALIAALGVVLELIVGTRSEFYFLKRFSTPDQIAFYSIAFSAVTALRLVPRSLGGATAPAFATLFGAQAWERIRRGFGRSFRFILTATLPLTAVALALGPPLVRQVYGSDYAGVEEPLRILLAGFPLIALSSVTNSLLGGFGMVRRTLVANAIAAGVDVGLAAALVPSLAANGAAIANVGGEGTYVILAIVFAVRRIGRFEWRPGLVARSVLASAAAGGTASGAYEALGGVGGLAAGAVVAPAAYLIVGGLLRVVDASDAAWLTDAFGSKGRGLVGRLVRLLAERT